MPRYLPSFKITIIKVAALGKAIAATPDSVTCSAAEKTSLKEQVTLLDAIAAVLEAFVSELKEAIKVSKSLNRVHFLFSTKKIFQCKIKKLYLSYFQTATGSEPTDSELDNVDTSSTSSTTKKAVLRRDRIVKDLLARM